MSRVAVVYWSGMGNTEAMAKAVAEGARNKGAEVDLLTASEVSSVAAYDGVALGCPAMGSEELEESEFEPMLAGIEPELAGKRVALFGSFDWGVGQWMRSWEERCAEKGIALCSESVKANNAPDDKALAACRSLGWSVA